MAEWLHAPHTRKRQNLGDSRSLRGTGTRPLLTGREARLETVCERGDFPQGVEGVDRVSLGESRVFQTASSSVDSGSSSTSRSFCANAKGVNGFGKKAAP